VDAAAQTLLALVEQQLPTRPTPRDEWHAYAAASVCRMSEAARSRRFPARIRAAGELWPGNPAWR